MTLIYCTRENAREALSDEFPNPSSRVSSWIDYMVENIERTHWTRYDNEGLGVTVMIVREAP